RVLHLHSFPTRRSSDLGIINITLETLAEYLGGAAVIITILFFGYIIFFGGHSKEEQKKLGIIFWLFILAALFWSGFEQAGSSLKDRKSTRLNSSDVSIT